MNNKLSILFVIIILISFTISGYYSKQDINDLAYVVAIGIDVGENNDLKVSFQLSIPSKNNSQGGDSSSASDTVIDTIECSSIESGISLANGYVSKKINLSHCKVLVISEEVAVKRDIWYYFYFSK